MAKENVLKYLEAFASGIGKQSEEISISFYEIGMNQMDTHEQREAFRLGSLAVLTGVSNMRIRHSWYTHKFKKAINKIKRGNNK